MPPIFSPASPLGTEAAIGVGAGQASVTEKYAPLLAHIYDSMASSLANRGSGGGGHGGGGGSNSYIQVLPSGDGGALAQVEQQANREQSALNLGFEYGQDPVSKHIALQNQGRLDLLRQAQAPNAQPGPPPQVQPPPQEYGPEDVQAETHARQAIANTDKALASLEISPETANMMKAPFQDQLAELQKKKQAVEENKAKQAYDAQVKSDAMTLARNDVASRHLDQFGYRSIPEVIAPDKRYDIHGKQYLANKEEYESSVKLHEKAIEQNHQIDLAKVKAETQSRIEREKAAIKDPVIEQKLLHTERENYLAEADKVAAQIRKDDEAYRKRGEPLGKLGERTPEQFDKELSERMVRRGLAPTLKDALDQHTASRGKGQSPGTAQPHADDVQPSAPPAVPTQEDRQLMKEADPEVLDSFKTHVSTLPRTEQGQVDLDSASVDQLRALNDYYSKPKAIGVSKAAADAVRVKINEAVQAKHARKAMANPPVPRDSSALGRVYSAIDQRPNEDVDLGNGGHALHERPSKIPEMIGNIDWQGIRNFFGKAEKTLGVLGK